MSSPLSSLLLCCLLLWLPALVVAQQTRTLTLTNQCPEQFWFHITVGAIQNSPSCGSNSDCPSGSFCSGSACFYNLPSVSSGEWNVPANGGTNTLSFPYFNNGQSFQFSGNLAFCQAGSCGNFPAADTAANCNSAPGCAVYAGPSNQAEWTWLVQGADAYDISNIAGVSVPMSFGPVGVSASASNFYSCGTAGATDGPFPSSWSFSAPSPYYVWVTGGGSSCGSNSDCGGGEVCGLVNTPGANPQFALQCGTQLGYWTANAVCAQDESLGSPFDCQLQLGSPNSGLVLDELDRCSGAVASQSCYQPGAADSCCGCANWNSILGDNAVPSYTEQCQAINPNWQEYVQPDVQWLKAGAPNSYTFPYDDPSSSFTCEQTDGNNFNIQSYQITLCPGGSSGSGGGGTVGDDGPYMSTTAPPTQSLPQCGAGNSAYYGTGTESVTAYEFPNQAPSSGSFSVTVLYNNAEARYIHVDLCTSDWDCFSTQYDSTPAPAGTGSVTFTVNVNDAPDYAGGYVWSVWTVGTVDEQAAQPYLYKHAWQVYTANVGSSIENQNC